MFDMAYIEGPLVGSPVSRFKFCRINEHVQPRDRHQALRAHSLLIARRREGERNGDVLLDPLTVREKWAHMRLAGTISCRAMRRKRKETKAHMHLYIVGLL